MWICRWIGNKLPQRLLQLRNAKRNSIKRILVIETLSWKSPSRFNLISEDDTDISEDESLRNFEKCNSDPDKSFDFKYDVFFRGNDKKKYPAVIITCDERRKKNDK